MRSTLTIIALLALTGCAATSVNDMRAPDGSALKNVKCNMDSQKCFVTASASCKETDGLYRVVASHSNAGGTLADIFPGPVTWYNMTYTCGPSDGKMPEFAFKGSQYTPAPVIINQPKQRSTTTNCYKAGNNVSCTSN